MKLSTDDTSQAITETARKELLGAARVDFERELAAFYDDLEGVTAFLSHHWRRGLSLPETLFRRAPPGT